MSNQSKFIAGLLLGAAAGAAIAYLMTSDRGKEILADLKSAASNAGEEVKAAANEVETEINEALEKGKEWVSNLKSNANSFTS